MKQRRQELSVLNVLFCLLVIMIHILSYPVAHFTPGTIKFTFFMIPWRMSSFVVQGFVFLAGVKLFLTGKDEMSYPEYLKYRFKAILGPYVFCSIIYCLAYIVVLSYTITLDFYLDGLIFGSLAVHFYFITLLVQFDLMFPLWKKMVNRLSPILVIPIAYIASAYFETHLTGIAGIFTHDMIPIYNDRLFTTYLSFWVIGCYVGRYYDQFCEILKKNFKFICGLFGTMFVICLLASCVAYNEFRMIHGMNTIHYVYATSAILFLMAVALKLPKNTTDRIPLFSFTDKHSYDIYLWHLLVILASDLFVRVLGLAMQSLAFIFRVLFVYSGTYFGVYILQKLRDIFLPKPVQNKYIPPKQMRFKIRYTTKPGLR